MSKQTKQVLLRMPVSVVKKLNQAAIRFQHRSGSQIAADIVVRCFPIWKLAEEQRAKVFEAHYPRDISAASASKGPIPDRAKSASRKKGRK